IDTPGDEGEKFSALVRGQNLTTQELGRINIENDWANITVGGEQVAVEQNTPIVLTVTTTADQNDGTATGGLSLRDAILIANANTTNDYIIELQGGQTYSLSIKNTASLNNGGNEQAAVTGDLDILSGGKITIKSVGTQKAIIDATNLKTSFASGFGDSAIDVKENAYLILDGVTITGASLGAVWINDKSTAEINNSIITNNTITVASAGSYLDPNGGGIINNGTLLLKDSTISNNSAAGWGGGIFNNSGTVTITNTTISNNSAEKSGGGISNGDGTYSYTAGTITINNTTISGNSAKENGGGIFNGDGFSYDTEGTITMNNTTISGNSARENGGGIFNREKTYLNNSTITNNTADLDSNNNGKGGGIYNFDDGYGTTEEVYTKNTIIVNNFHTPNNSGSPANGIYNPDISGLIYGNNHNLIGNLTGASGTIGTGTDIVKPNILLGPLQNNGGTTQTHALLDGSPAINAGNNNNIPLDVTDTDGDGNTTETTPFDQRGTGFSRIANNRVDIGAFEFQGIPSPIIKINNISILEGNSGTKTGTVTVNLNAVTDKTVTVNYTTANNNAIAGIDYTATSGQLSFAPGETTKTITVTVFGDNIAEANESFFVNLSNATNAIIDPNAGQGIVTITDDEPHPIILGGNSLPNPAITLTVNTTADQNDGSATNGLSLRDAILIANADTTNDYIINLTGGTTYSLTAFSLIDTKGGDLDILGKVTIQSTGTQPATIDASGLTSTDRVFEVSKYLNLSNIVVKGGLTTRSGGGIYIGENATALLFNTTVKDNSSSSIFSSGGGIYNGGVLALINSTVADNQVVGSYTDGGGIYNSGQAILLGTTIKNNTGRSGGGIYNSKTLTISNSTIYNNIGEGISQSSSSSTINLINSTVSGNQASRAGGIDASGGVVNVVNSTITQNTATSSYSGVGGIDSDGGTVNLRNSIVAGNIGIYPDIEGNINGNNNNLIGNLTGASGTIGTGTDIVNPNPKLGLLQDNGNGIFTHALLSGSPAINAGNNALIITDVFDLDADGNDNSETIPFDNRGSGFTRISSGTVDIGAFEFQPALNLSLSINDVTLTEGNSGTKNATFTVTLSGETFQPVTVNYATANGTATAGSDYTATTGTLIFNVNPGETSKQITVSVLGDSLFEANETFFVNLSNATNASIADAQAQGTITNDDVALPTITLAVSPSSVTEDSTTNLVYTFTRTGATTSALTVNYGITGTANSTDYTGATPGTGKTITFAAGASTATLTIDPTADTIVESNETVALTLATGTGYTIGTTTAVIGTITNDDLLPNLNLSANQTIVEGNTNPQNVTYTVTLSSTSTQTITVQYATANSTAIAGSDYTSTSGTLTFNPGVTSQVINIPILNDSLNEANETFSLTLNSPTNASLGTSQTVTTTITDTLSAAATTTLPTNVENLTLTGTTAINGTGNAGNNVITGNSVNNTLSGLNGNDTYSFVANSALGTDTITETATGGIDNLDFTGTTAAVNVNLGVATSQTVNSNLKLILSANNVIENATGGTGNDRLTGNALNNTLNGGSGNDQLQGLGGNDTLWGGAGNDILNGGTGNDSLWGGLGDDILTGGVGNDQYLFQSDSVFSTSLGVDYISEFEAGLDQIVLSKATFNAITNTVGQALTDFAVVSDDEFVNASNARIVFSQGTGSLFYNQDGSILGTGTVFEFARLGNPDITLTSSNFSLIA
ncbi:beta strand repeat-containing protein, partial [Dolichospermum circinale]|uniref:beta strand repeat-containing protein n=1 Tax=Dolichospermum circinale TaxID=109265 RepID=UPI0018C92C1E